MTPFLRPLLAVLCAGVLAACNDDPDPYQTLDGNQTLVVGHRGASGYLPEHTL